MTCEIVPAPFQDYAETIALAACCISDFPYSRKVHEQSVSGGMVQYGEGPHVREYGFTHLTPTTRRAAARVMASVRGWSLVYSDVESAWLWRISCEAAGARYVRGLPWVRWSQPQKTGDRPPSGWEQVSLFRGGGAPRAHWSGPGSLIELEHEDDGPDALRQKSLRGKNGVDKFSAEKPLDQMLDLVSWFSDPGTLVVDLTAGSGTTIAACALLGRDGLGFEIDPVTAAAAAARVARAETGDLSDRDGERVLRWTVSAVEGANQVPAPKDKSQVRTWERAQRRLADVERVRKAVGL
jgi:hypothetical protein